MSVLLSLDNLEKQLAYALNDGASVVFWSHRRLSCDWLILEEDRTKLRGELRNLRIAFGMGEILSVTSEAPLRFGSRTLYPMGVEMKDIQCEAYFLLRRRGNTEDLKYTPYFFVSETERNDSVDHLLKGGPGPRPRDLSHEDVKRN